MSAKTWEAGQGVGIWSSVRPSVRTAGLIGLVCLLSLAGFLFASYRTIGFGYPLDDAWIHQTYARNLAQWGEWSYLHGQLSAGSTAPLWSVLLAVGYVLRLNPNFWTYLLGGLGLFGAALGGEALFRALVPHYRGRFPWAGVFLAGEWHLVWAAASGMETALYAAMILFCLWLVVWARARTWTWIGVLIGLGVWVRPDAITLLGPSLLVLVLAEPGGWQGKVRALGWLAAGFLLPFGAYLAFNRQIQGTWWPNTFYAKQAEYALMRDSSLLLRYFDQLKLPLIGSGLFLLPGFGWMVVWSWQRRSWPGLASIAWFLGFAGLYALRLPVTYQYGRYLMPAMPVYFVLGLCGTVLLLAQWKGRLAWVLSRALVLSAVGVWLAFNITVAGMYARDVAIIETEMIATARWVAANTEPDALVAAHDIGALGYYGHRRLVDLAGLISPEVIPFMRDEAEIGHWLDRQGVDYLVTFAGWYPQLPQGKPVIFKSDGNFSPKVGGENMWVFQW